MTERSKISNGLGFEIYQRIRWTKNDIQKGWHVFEEHRISKDVC